MSYQRSSRNPRPKKAPMQPSQIHGGGGVTHPSVKSHPTEKRTLKTAPYEIDSAQKREYKDLNSGQNQVGGRPCPSGQTHGLTDRTTPPSAELSHPRGFRRPPCPPVPCLGNPESQAALPEVRLHDASSGGRVVVWGVCVLMFPIGVVGGWDGGGCSPSVFWGFVGGLFSGFFWCLAGFSVFFRCCFAAVQLLNGCCFARGVGGDGFRVFWGFLPVFGGVFMRGRFTIYFSRLVRACLARRMLLLCR